MHCCPKQTINDTLNCLAQEHAESMATQNKQFFLKNLKNTGQNIDILCTFGGLNEMAKIAGDLQRQALN